MTLPMSRISCRRPSMYIVRVDFKNGLHPDNYGGTDGLGRAQRCRETVVAAMNLGPPSHRSRRCARSMMMLAGGTTGTARRCSPWA